MNESDDKIKYCPASGSRQLKYIGDDQETNTYGIGLLHIHGFTGKVYEDELQWECQRCLYQFK